MSPLAEPQNRIRMLETRYNFDAKSRLASAKFDYLYNLDLTNPVLEGRIGGQTLPSLNVHHGWTSTVAASQGKTFILHPHDLNVTSITDNVATFTFGSNFEALSLGGRELFRSEHVVDSCGQIEASFLRMVKGSSEFKQNWKYIYDEDGQLESASMADNSRWRFVYDLSGHLLSTVTQRTNAGSKSPPASKLNFEYETNGLFKGTFGTISF